MFRNTVLAIAATAAIAASALAPTAASAMSSRGHYSYDRHSYDRHFYGHRFYHFDRSYFGSYDGDSGGCLYGRTFARYGHRFVRSCG
jgi:hypothetical protein